MWFAMKTATKDFALCANRDCLKKDTCIRWHENYEKTKDARCFVLTSRGQKECELYEVKL